MGNSHWNHSDIESPSTTAPQVQPTWILAGPNELSLNDVAKQTNSEDPEKAASAKLLLHHQNTIQDLKKQVEDSLAILKKKEDSFDEDLKRYRSDLRQTNQLLIGGWLVTSLTFIITLITFCWNEILSNKTNGEIQVQYNQVYKNYADQIITQKNEIDGLKSEVDEVKNEVQRLRDKNPALK